MRITYPKPALNELSRYYQSDEYIHHTRSKLTLFDKIYRIIQNYMFGWKYKHILKSVKAESKTVLDIGCGSGLFLDYIHKKGWAVEGVEESDEARKSTSHMNVYKEEQFLSLNKKYSLITLWHVLEHLWNIDSYLNKISNLMTDETALLIAVPNYKSVDAKHYAEFWEAYDAPRHLYHFSPDSLDKLLAGYNLEIVNKKQLPFDSFYVSIKSEQKKHGFIGNALLIGIRSFIAGLFNQEKSSSILYFVRKKN